MDIKYCLSCGTELAIEYSKIICYNQENGRPLRYEIKYCPVRKVLPWYKRLGHYDYANLGYLIEREGE